MRKCQDGSRLFLYRDGCYFAEFSMDQGGTRTLFPSVSTSDMHAVDIVCHGFTSFEAFSLRAKTSRLMRKNIHIPRDHRRAPLARRSFEHSAPLLA